MKPIHTPPRPPTSVIDRCAATDGHSPFGGCHGVTASGANDAASAQVVASMAELSASMRIRRERWEARQVAR